METSAPVLLPLLLVWLLQQRLLLLRRSGIQRPELPLRREAGWKEKCPATLSLYGKSGLFFLV